MKLRLLCSALLSGVLVGCATQPPALPEASRLFDLDRPHARADREVFGLRIDLVRKESLGAGYDASKPSSPSSAAFDPSVYAPTGVDAGNGLFVDTNGNLAVDLVRLYSLPTPFTVEETIAGALSRKVHFVTQGTTFQRTGGGQDLPDLSVTVDGDQIVIVSTAGAYQGSVYNDSEGLVFAPAGFRLTGRTVLKQVGPDRVESPSLAGTTMYSVKSDTDADLAGRFRLKVVGNVLQIRTLGSVMNDSTPFRFVRTTTGCWFSDLRGDSHEIKKDGDTITVWKNDKLEKTFQVLPASP